MAAISITTPTRTRGNTWTIENKTAQASTGQTTWIEVPYQARAAIVYLNLTAVAGTTPLLDFKLKEADPVARDDTYSVDFADWNGVTQLTAAGFAIITIGPGNTGIADDDTASYYKLNGLLPELLGFTTTLDRTTGNETYTYTIAVRWLY